MLKRNKQIALQGDRDVFLSLHINSVCSSVLSFQWLCRSFPFVQDSLHIPMTFESSKKNLWKYLIVSRIKFTETLSDVAFHLKIRKFMKWHVKYIPTEVAFNMKPQGKMLFGLIWTLEWNVCILTSGVLSLVGNHFFSAMWQHTEQLP